MTVTGGERVALTDRGELSRAAFGLHLQQAPRHADAFVDDLVRLELSIAAVRDAG